MGDVSPQQFFRFAADNADLMQDLHRKSGGLSESDVYSLIRKYADHNSPSASHVFDRLVELNILDSAPDATARYELTRPVAVLMRFLLRQYRLTNVAVIQSYFKALEQQTDQLEQAQNDKKPELWMRVALELTDHLETMRHDSHNNRNGVIAAVMQIKTAKDRITPTARYAEVNRLWQTYIIPLRDMIDSRKLLDTTLKRTGKVLKDVSQTVGAGRREVLQRAEDIEARLIRLRRDVLNDFEESLREITPLYEELRRENALARGASAIIEKIMSKGFRSLELAGMLGIPNWQMQGQFSDAALEAHIAGISAYIPSPPDPIPAATDLAPQNAFDMQQFDETVHNALPIEDGLAWLAENFPAQPPALVLRLYGRLHSEYYGPAVFGAKRKTYALSGRHFRASPMRIVNP